MPFLKNMDETTKREKIVSDSVGATIGNRGKLWLSEWGSGPQTGRAGRGQIEYRLFRSILMAQ